MVRVVELVLQVESLDASKTARAPDQIAYPAQGMQFGQGPILAPEQKHCQHICLIRLDIPNHPVTAAMHCILQPVAVNHAL